MPVETQPQPIEAPSAFGTEVRSSPVEPSTPGRPFSIRWPILMLALAASTVGMFVLPSPFPLFILLGLVGCALVVAARDAQWTPAGAARELRQLLTGHRTLSPDDLIRNLRLSLFCAVFAVGFMVLAAIGFRPSPNQDRLTVPLLFAIAGAISLGVAVWFGPTLPLFQRPAGTPLTPARSRWGATVSGVVLLAALAHISSAKAQGDVVVQPVSNDIQFALLVAGSALIVWGLSGATVVDVASLRARFRWRRFLPLLAIFALALGLRVWQLGDAIRGSVDEALILEGVFHSWGYRAAGLVTHVSDLLPVSQLFSYWQTIVIGIFGRSLEAFRLTNALVGALSIFAIYLLGHALFDRKTGLVAALLLATFPPHLHFSRIAIPHIADPLFGTLALTFLARGLKHNRRLDWALCGVSLGLTQYFYEGGRLLFPPLLVLIVVVIAIVFRRRIHYHRQGIVVAGLAALFVLAPVYYSLFTLDRPRTSRLSESGIDLNYILPLVQGQATPEQVRDLSNRLTLPFQVYVHQPDITRFYGGEQALILDWLTPIFLIGVAYLLWRVNTPSVAVLLWLFFAALANVLMRDIANAPRFVIVFPALALTLAVGIRYGLALLLPWLSGRRLAIAVAVLAGLVAFGQVNYYFNQHLPLYRQQLRGMSAYDGMDAVLRAQAIPPTTQVMLVGQPPYDGGVARIFDAFLSRRVESMSLRSLATAEVTPAYLAALPRDHDYAFFIAPGSETLVPLLMQFFNLDGPRFSSYTDVPVNRMYALYLARWRPPSG